MRVTWPILIAASPFGKIYDELQRERTPKTYSHLYFGLLVTMPNKREIPKRVCFNLGLAFLHKSCHMMNH